MKKFICLAFILFAAIGIFAQDAQEKPIEKSEFDKISLNSFRKFAGQSYRQTEVVTGVLESILPSPIEDKRQNNFSSKSITEFSFADRGSRTIYEFDSSTFKKKTETIRVGNKIYIRIDEGEWAEEKPDIRQKFENKLKMIEEKIEYKSLGTEKLDSQNTSVYAKIQKQKLVNESNKSEMSVTVTTKYWFGEDGGKLKEEVQRESHVKSGKSTIETISNSLGVTIWELDPGIKIEAPITEK